MIKFKKVKLGQQVDLYAEIQEINEDCFNGELDTPILEISEFDDLAGYMMFFGGVYHIGITLGMGYYCGMATIMHEMVHIWQHQRGMITMNHDTTFNRKCQEMEKFYGYPPKTIQGRRNENNYFKKVA